MSTISVKIATGTWDVIRDSFTRYRWQSFAVILSTIIAGMAESLGLLTMFPLIQLGLNDFSNSGAAADSELMTAFTAILGYFGLPLTLPVLLAIIVLAMAVKAALTLAAKTYIGSMTAQVATDLRLALIGNLLQASWSYFTNTSSGRFANAISNEAARASSAYLASWSLIAAVIQIVFFLAASAFVSPVICFFGLVIGGGVMKLLGWTVRLSRAAGVQETELMSNLVSRLADNIAGIKPLKAMGLERLVLPLLNREAQGLHKAHTTQAFAVAAQQTLPEPIMVLVVAAGIYAALTYTDTALGELIVIALLFNRTMGRISQFQKFYQMLNATQSAYISINATIDEAARQTARRHGGVPPPALAEGIVLRDVAYAYGATPIFSGLNLTFPARSLTALIGPSGSGKTTVADLVTGLLTPAAGDVLVDGMSLRAIDTAAWQAQIGYVPQELYLFHDTISHNITLKDETLSEADVWAALEQAGAADFVRALPEGLQTVIGERGSKLSGGQRQRLMIARALVRRPRLLILDEATTALDPQTEQALCETVRALSKQLTVIAISHQPAIKTIADQVIDLHKVRG